MQKPLGLARAYARGSYPLERNISVWDVMCNAEGCLTRIGDAASDISASDQVHFTEKGSVFLVQSIIDQLLRGRTARSANEQ